MSKVIKQMQMDSLKHTFKGVRDLVLLNVVGLGAIPENKIRLDLRKKGIRLQMVKNSLARRVFAEFLGTGLLVAAVVGSGIAAQRGSPNDVGLQLFENFFIVAKQHNSF